ncbi:MAG: ATP-binding protein, partial [Boseongicola sp. SB0676_bin_33]|nr:ATP-binding protein [Boseongicola sp. SB0676_bin_33]
MAKAGLTFAGFADHEGNAPGRWQTLKANVNERLFQWQSGCLEANVIRLVDADKPTELVKDQDGDLDGDRLRTLADRLGCAEKDLETLLSDSQAQVKRLRALMIAAATGDT